MAKGADKREAEVTRGGAAGNRRAMGMELEYALLAILLDRTDGDNPLTAAQLARLCGELYGIEVDQQAVRRRLDGLVAWMQGAEARGSSRARDARPVLGCEVASRVQGGRGNPTGYYVERRPFSGDEVALLVRMAVSDAGPRCAGGGDVADLAERLAALASPTLRWQAAGCEASRLPAAGEARMPGVFETLHGLAEAIERGMAVDFYYERWHVEGPVGKGGACAVTLFGGTGHTGRASRGNDQVLDQLPFALRYMDGHYYVLLEANNRARGTSFDLARRPRSSDYRICRVDRIRKLEVHEPGDRRHLTCPSDEVVERFFRGAVGGMGHERGQQPMRLRVSAYGIQAVCERFRYFDGFQVFRGDPGAKEGQGRAQPVSGKRPKHQEPWYTVKFEAHPAGVARWALKHIDCVEIKEPAWARDIVVKTLRHNAYGV